MIFYPFALIISNSILIFLNEHALIIKQSIKNRKAKIITKINQLPYQTKSNPVIIILHSHKKYKKECSTGSTSIAKILLTLRKN